MAKKEDTVHSVLIISASEQFDAFVRRSLRGFIMVDSRKSAAAARRSILEQYFDLVVINAPLRDEPGQELAIDVAQQCSASVLLVAPSEDYDTVLERVTDYGILVISKPVPRERIDKAIRYLTAQQNKIQRLENKVRAMEEKMEETRVVNKAKFLLVGKRHMTEDEAHRYIGKQAMDNGVSRRRIAQRILEEDEE